MAAQRGFGFVPSASIQEDWQNVVGSLRLKLAAIEERAIAEKWPRWRLQSETQALRDLLARAERATGKGVQ